MNISALGIPVSNMTPVKQYSVAYQGHRVNVEGTNPAQALAIAKLDFKKNQDLDWKDSEHLGDWDITER
jgi:hypothetical protein